MDVPIPLAVAAMAFAAFLIWKTRPALSAVATAKGREAAAASKAAQARLAAAKDDAERAIALCDAGDAAARLGKMTSASGFYLRALRADPASTIVVQRVTATFARRPGALETLLWRHLSHASFVGAGRDAAVASMRALANVYARKRRTEPRAKAIERALEALTSPATSRDGA